MRDRPTASPSPSGCTRRSSATMSCSTAAATVPTPARPSPPPIPTPSSAFSRNSPRRIWAVSSGRFLLGLGGLLLLAPRAGAQGLVSGRVMRRAGADTVPVGGAVVVLHRVGRAAQGPVDTTVADAAGRFRLRFTPDTTAAWLLSAPFAGIEYFSSPLTADPAHPDTGLVILVSDTASTAPIRLRLRTLLVSRPDESGTRTVVDWFVLANSGPLTRVAPDSLHPSWSTPLPEFAQNVELADLRLSQFSADAVVFRRDSALLFAPLSPGDKELMLEYRIPGALGRFTVPFGGRVRRRRFAADRGTGVPSLGGPDAPRRRARHRHAGTAPLHRAAARAAGVCNRGRLPRPGVGLRPAG